MKPSRPAIDAWAKRPVKSLENIRRQLKCLAMRTYVTKDTANAVGCEDIKSIIVSEGKLELGRKVTNGAGHKAEENGSGCGGRVGLQMRVTSLGPRELLTRADETRSRGDSDQTRDSARAEANSGPLALQTVVPKHPGDSTDRGSEVGHNTGRGSADIRRQSAATVETEPTEPEEDRPEHNIGGVVGLVGEFFGPITAALAEVDGNGKGGGTRGNVDGSSTRKIETTLDERPTLGVPGHVGEWIVDDCSPEE